MKETWKYPATKKAADALTTYLYEQECGELRSFSVNEVKTLKEAWKLLVNKSKLKTVING